MSQTNVITSIKPLLSRIRSHNSEPPTPNNNVDANTNDTTDKEYSFDPEALTEKYREEREKRIQYTRNRGGLKQYHSIQAQDQFSPLLDDPYVSHRLERDPIHKDCEAVVIGGGYGAQLTAVELLRNGINDFLMIDKSGDFGGTWYWNRYPGAQCDIESYVYMPLLDEMDYVPTKKYASGEELFHHAQAIGRKYDLYSRAQFQTEVKVLQWNEERARWDVKTDRGDVFSARFVIPVAGPLHRPKLPDLPGLGSFKGHSFHTTRWDYDYTGGDSTDPSQPLSKLADKRVGIIGTGATAVQVVPHLGESAKHLYVFQRTPSSIDIRGNRTTDPEWVKTLGEHWQTKRMDNFNIIVNGGDQDEDLVSDGWTDILRKLHVAGAKAIITGDSAQQKKQEETTNENENEGGAVSQRQLVDFEKMEQIRRRCDEVVTDPSTAEALKPYYNQFCKRPCFHDDYLPTFNRPNVTLIDTQGAGVDAITETGIVANGQEIELDCIIFATGFDLASDWSAKTGLEVFGRGGVALSEKWKDGPSTLHGYTTRDFPNFFPISHVQAALSPNFLHMIGFQAKHIAYVMGICHQRDFRTVEPTQEAQDQWVQTIIRSSELRRQMRSMCTPGYYNNEGDTSPRLRRNAPYGGGCLEFMDMLTQWREQGQLQGLDLQPWSGQ